MGGKGGPVSKPAHPRKLGACLTPGSWGACLHAVSPWEVGGPVSTPAHPGWPRPPLPSGAAVVGSSCQNPHLLSPRNLISIRCWPLAVWHGTGALEGLLSPLEQKKKKRKPLLIPKGVRSKSGNKPRQNSCSFYSSCFLLYRGVQGLNQGSFLSGKIGLRLSSALAPAPRSGSLFGRAAPVV